MRSSPIRRKSFRVSGATPPLRPSPRASPTVPSPCRVTFPTAPLDASACERAETPVLREAALLEEAERAREETAAEVRSDGST